MFDRRKEKDMKKLLIATHLFLLCVIYVQYHNNTCLEYKVGMEKHQTKMMLDKLSYWRIYGKEKID